jgi:hypothetical protein
MRITQSISLSNIQTFSLIVKARPWAVKTCRILSACFLIGVAH